MKCHFCKGKTEIKNIDVDFRWGDQLFVVKNVPAEVCTQCGKSYYSAKISKKLDELAAKQTKPRIDPQKTLEVPVYNWSWR